MRAVRLLTLAVAALTLIGCGAAMSTASPRRARWTTFVHVRRPVDLAGPRSDGSFVLAADGRLWVMTSTGRTTPIDPRYRVSPGPEPYIALAGARGCFTRGAIYAIRLQSGRGVTEVAANGSVKRFATVSAPGLINGIAFDTTGRCRHRLLLTVNARHRTAVLSVDCRGRVRTVTQSAPRVEGGIAVVPPGRTRGWRARPSCPPGACARCSCPIASRPATTIRATTSSCAWEQAR